MPTDEQIREALSGFIRSLMATSFVGVVKANDKAESDRLVEVEHNELTYEVRLQAIAAQEATGMLAVPKVESLVFCVPEGLSSESYVVVQCSAIEKWLLTLGKVSVSVSEEQAEVKVGESTALLTEKEISLNGGSNGGLVIAEKLVADLKKVNDFIEAFQQQLSTPINEPGNGSPSAFQAALSAALASKTLGDYSKIENEKVKH